MSPKIPSPKGRDLAPAVPPLFPPTMRGTLLRSNGALPLALLGSSGQALQGEFGMLVPPVSTCHRLSGAEQIAPTTPYLSALFRK